MKKLLAAMAILLCFTSCNQPPLKPEPSPTAVIRAFVASWCIPCKQDQPRLERLEAQGVRVERIDVDENPVLASQFGVVSIPAYFLYEPHTGNWKRISIR